MLSKGPEPAGMPALLRALDKGEIINSLVN
jgi:hypothetical protein